ncbi:leukocyte immunoglobulin-like receptor subfamily A member 2 isoform X2 [Bubalus bubalis]|uniref:leukocyte immunoglobulin-like receptor subfamily A member 2 isoform X2 n=1 Tax=Bubalus bubalis TaxID=89462 RepID=UPI001E1B67E0|nr:leukocyte immunoglobulin-like receptor subfamily A member 2 isoform X2 [Bubalus bubalis]
MRGSATTLTFTTLLCLEVLPKPSIWADPGTLVTQGSPVTIWCQGSLLADVYHLHRERGSVYWEAKAPQGSRNKAWFHFEYASSSDAGQYQCAYQSRNCLSEHSDPLPLVITGMHRKPSLSARPGASVPQGEDVTLQCHSEVQSDTFHLSKEGSLTAPQHLHLQNPAPPIQANFTLRAVTSAHSGTYRCYSSHSTAPHLLSIPSDPLELQVSGAPDSISPPQNKSDSKSDYTVQNLIRMGLAALVLLLPGVLLCQAWHDCRGARDVAQS